MNHIGLQLKRAAVAAKVGSADDLVPVAIDLYPEEVLAAAQRDIGKEVITDYFAEMYRFGLDAAITGTKIQAKQLTGIRLTHKKIQAWLKAKDINDILDLNNQTVMRVYLEHHIKQIDESLQMFKIISSVLAGEQ